ncbi:RNA polymerase sigma factor RpoH [Coxiella endosymbiont of Amblyomma americanum]|uniref:RNA polymerase sigma factor RpoH n=1 Tax=Coxiella endosymbiont of Amblyomma americanum TaxID=325775 RepID=UPI0005805926|nr:RNA polymerase sigma factor RpoH [Coxiella endosymbiont of Amblyomma americanum]AJC50150.1 RNA polymerase factor sigma-32 [Coxiella endosymbiont of Amblyomma americanum]AUJ58510.1 RNA polymerase sigma factor RpoH [Coxiella-like endosymbiont of Amblyomma americanum]
MNNLLTQVEEQSLAIGNLGSYISWVNRIPMLSVEEERRLSIQFQKKHDLASARELILSHLRFVVRIARRYTGYGLSQSDLIQEGNIGLMKAVRRFDPKMGVRLVSFAIHWIRAEIHEFILKNWRIVKIATTKAQRKLFFNLRKHAKKRGWFSDREVAVLAEELNVNTRDVRQMEERLNSHDEAFDGTAFDSIDDESYSGNTGGWGAPAHYLEDKRYNPALQLERSNWSEDQEQRLHKALQTLDARSQDILHQRWLNEQKLTLNVLAEKYNISAERIRQLEKNAMQKIREAMTV